MHMLHPYEASNMFMAVNENHRGKCTVLTRRTPRQGKENDCAWFFQSLFQKYPGDTTSGCSKYYMNPGEQRRRNIAREDLHGRNSTKKP